MIVALNNKSNLNKQAFIEYCQKLEQLDTTSQLILCPTFLNAGIASNENWKSKEFWQKIIDYSINFEINNSQGFSIFLEEDSIARKNRVESAITSNIITFLFNMKLFKFPEEKYKELIEDLINKYKIENGEAIYGTLNSINIEIENENKKNGKNQNDNIENK